ncbi:NAD(+)/NADH kinase [bacterium]|nr:NAD(+)/NADH kinase [bacterium]
MSGPVSRVGVVVNTTKRGIGGVVDQLVALVSGHGAEVLVCGNPEDGVSRTLVDEKTLVGESEILIALGGDGTILHAASLVQEKGTPILGVNLGRLGFLADSAPEELEDAIDRLIQGSYRVDERLALEATVGDTKAFSLNEIVIEKGVLARLIELKTWIGEVPVSSFWGNGLIVSTPTGSTSYSLSAGGPVLHPSLDSLIITPICPHSLSQRPLVVPADQQVRVQVVAEHVDIILTADGRTVQTMTPEDRVIVRRSARRVRLIDLQGLSFYELLRRKLDWNVASRTTKDT